VDHPLAPPPVEVHPWRATALVASAVAAVELVVIVVAGVALLGSSLGHHATATKKKTAVHHARRQVPPAPKPEPVPKPKLTRAETTVLVLNGNGISGAAAAASGHVRALGYRIGGVGDATPRADGRSVIMYRPAYRAEGLRLARDLHVSLVGPLDGLRADQMGRAHVAYIVGS